ncbi:MAG TPA: zf-HC2 domain-containing protein [Candidatus Angelobacter sp.]|nr:zf-HC2 domain-containing protein [Candidatus Angelobacter sp.]
MRCTEARPLFSLYLDGAVTGAEMHQVSGHLNECAECRSEYASLEKTRDVVAGLGRKQTPPDLAMRLHIAIASERSRRSRNWLSGYWVRAENALHSVMFPATAGVLAAVIFFAAMIGFFVPARVSADDDVPTLLYTPPRLEMSDVDSPVNLDSPVVIETYVGVNGRVEAYRIISGQDTPQVRMELNRTLLFTVFAPAQSFGKAVPGKAIMSFSHVNVKG